MMIDGLKKMVVGKSIVLGFIAWNLILHAISMDTPFVKEDDSEGVKIESTMQESPYRELSGHVNGILESIVEETMSDKLLASFEASHQNIVDASINPCQGTEIRKRAFSNSRIKVYSSPKEPRVRRTSSGNMNPFNLEHSKPQEEIRAIVRRTSSGDIIRPSLERVKSQERVASQLLVTEAKSQG